MDKDRPTDPRADEAPSSLMMEFASAVEALETALGEATRNAAYLKTALPRVAALERVLTELEVTMARARQQVTSPATEGTPRDASSPSLRTVSAAGTSAAPAESEPAPGVEEKPAEAAETDRRSFVMEIVTDEGALDLKDVDRSVSENPGVVDVALLDYEGGRVSLRIWVEQGVDLSQIQAGLTERIKKNLATDSTAGNISVNLVEEAAA